MPIPEPVVNCYKYIDSQTKNYIEELKRLVKVQNVSSDLNAEEEIFVLINWMCEKLKSLGFSVLQRRPGRPDLKKKNIPPIIVAHNNKNHSNKKTVLYYGHLDVLDVQRRKWKTPPFELTEKNGRLYGRGVAKMKGPLLSFLHAIEAYRKLNIDIPVNIKIVCESMHQCQSIGLKELLFEMRTNFLSDVDCILMTDSKWLTREYPCIVYGMRGVSYFNLTIEGLEKDLSSGEYGGIVREPMQDLIYIMNGLVSKTGKVTVPHFYDDVIVVTPEEEEFYKKIKIDIQEYKKKVGVYKLGHHEQPKLTLMNVWRHPWFNVHYIKNSGDEFNLMNIPKKVSMQFSIRSVPNQTHEKISKLIINHVHELMNKVKSPNKLEINAGNFSNPWYEDHQHWNYQAANKATKQVYKEEANFIREGNGFPIIHDFRNAIPGRNILILPSIDCDSKVHSEEENLSIRCYIETSKVIVSYFWELTEMIKNYEIRSRKKKRYDPLCRS